LIPYSLIQTDAELAALVAGLRAENVRRLAIDVEGENNLHRYGIHVALIQLFDGKSGAIVDVPAITDRALLGQLLERAPWVLVWFDAANDLLSFQHALSLRPAPIQDLAIAARLLGNTGGLHALTGQPGSSSAKDKFQRANWLRRPLSRALLDYAISDVTHLLELADRLEAALKEKGLLAEFESRNTAAQEAERTWDPMANYVRIPGYHRLPPDDQRAARELWYARELYGRLRDVPPGTVASKQEMRAIIDRRLREPAGIAAFLNQGRRHFIVDAGDLGRMMVEAQGMRAAEPAGEPARDPAATPRPPGQRGARRGGRRRRGGR
jgi:ribonuclease D